jgi:UDPglucose--hexose-1-phosphate uridylyltransferase
MESEKREGATGKSRGGGGTMRYDLTTGDWVIYAPSRARRPDEFRKPADPNVPPQNSPDHCPFCPGNERLTPPEIVALREGSRRDSAGWRVRVVPNRFPALRIEEDHASYEEDHSFFRFRGGCGAHEVIIESPDHARLLCQQPIDQIELLLQTLQGRFNDLLGDSRLQSIIIFKNHGSGAGTSLVHPHFQLIATPVVPRMLRLRHAIAQDYFDMTGHCLYCVLGDAEMQGEKRLLAANSEYIAFLPYASHVPFEVWILPRTHAASFGAVAKPRLRPLAEMLKRVLQTLNQGLGNPDYNLAIDTAPRGDEDKTYFLWHIRILPRLTTPAGFELGSGMSINTVLPEEAAEFLRNLTLD